MSVNKVILLGHIGADPEIRSLPSGQAVANLRIATSEQWKDKETGEKKERTEWHSVTFYGARAEVIEKYFSKGSEIYVEGRLNTRKWQDKEGNDRYSTGIIGDQFSFTGGSSQQDRAEPAPRREESRPTRSGAKEGPTNQKARPAADEFDDDIPF